MQRTSNMQSIMSSNQMAIETYNPSYIKFGKEHKVRKCQQQCRKLVREVTGKIILKIRNLKISRIDET